MTVTCLDIFNEFYQIDKNIRLTGPFLGELKKLDIFADSYEEQYHFNIIFHYSAIGGIISFF